MRSRTAPEGDGAAITFRNTGVRFRVPRRSRAGPAPRLAGAAQWTIWGIRHVTFEVRAGEFVALIGPNGSGKTTLLRTAAGIYRPDEGTAAVRDGLTLLVSQGGLKSGLSGWENLELAAALAGLPRRRMRALASEIAEAAGIVRFMEAPVRVYSSGMRARLCFAMSALCRPTVLLLDEAVTSGDEAFRAWAEQEVARLVASGTAVVSATHDIERAAAMAHRVIRLEGGRHIVEGRG